MELIILNSDNFFFYLVPIEWIDLLVKFQTLSEKQIKWFCNWKTEARIRIPKKHDVIRKIPLSFKLTFMAKWLRHQICDRMSVGSNPTLGVDLSGGEPDTEVGDGGEGVVLIAVGVGRKS